MNRAKFAASIVSIVLALGVVIGTPADAAAPGTSTVTLTNASAPSAALNAAAIKVSWTLGTGAVDYVVNLLSGGTNLSTVTVLASACTTSCETTFSGLTGGTSYTANVIAEGTPITDVTLNSSSSFTAQSVPAAPTISAPISDATTVTLAWTAPLNTGGLPLGDYTITGDNGFAPVTALAGETSKVLSGLTVGLAYTFNIVASNSLGTSAVASFIEAVGLLTPPTTASFLDISVSYGATTQPVTPTSNSSGAFTYASSDPSVVAIPSPGTMLTYVGLGTATITATQASWKQYSSGTKTFTVTVSKASITITASSPTLPIGSPIPTITPTYTSLLNGDLPAVITGLSCSTAYTTSSAAGSAPATSCSGASATNYIIFYTAGSVNVTAPLPTVTGVSPATASAAGATAITITGTGFLNGATVSIGGVPATSVAFVSATSITAVTPAHAAGVVSVVVTNPDSGAGTGANLFTYTAAISTPTVTAISQASGSIAGGTALSITGTGFVTGATVSIGGVPATSVVFVSATSITAVTGAHASGAVNVVVTNLDGGVGTGTGLFTYVTGPTVTAISPAAGLITGGTAITITGTGFVTGATVSIGGVDATSVVFVSATSITAVTAAHASGTVNVVVTNPDLVVGTGTGLFTYGTAPTITLTTPVLSVIYGAVAQTLSLASNSTGTYTFSSSDATVATVTSPGGIVTYIGAGSATITVTQSAAGAYSIGTITIPVTVAKRLITLTPNSASKTYGGSDPVLTGFTITSGTLRTGESISIITQARAAGENASTYMIMSSSAIFAIGTINNYTITYALGVFTIAKASLTVTASSSIVNFGSPIPVITPTFSGFLNSDTATAANFTTGLTQPTCTTTYTIISAVGSHPTTSCLGGVATNYTFRFVAGSITINAAAGSPSPTPSPTPTVTASASPTPSPTPTPSASVSASPTPSASATATTKPVLATSYVTASRAITASVTVTIASASKSSITAKASKPLQILFSKVTKGTVVTQTIKAPNGVIYPLGKFKVLANGQIKLPVLKFAKIGTYTVTVSYGKIKKTVTIKVSI